MVFLSLTAFYFFLVSLDSNDLKAHYSAVCSWDLRLRPSTTPRLPAPSLVCQRSDRAKIFVEAEDVGIWSDGSGLCAGRTLCFSASEGVRRVIYHAHLVATPEISRFLIPWPHLLLAQGKALLNYGVQWPLALLAVIGLVVSVARPTKKTLWFAAAVLLAAGSVAGAIWPMIRYTLPLIPLIALAAALALTAARFARVLASLDLRSFRYAFPWSLHGCRP